MIGLWAICFALYFCNAIAVCPVAIAVPLRPLTSFPLPHLLCSMPKSVCTITEPFCLHIKTSPTPQKKKKNLAQNCAVNYCLLLREIRICPSIRSVSSLHCHQQMGVHHGVMYLQHSTRFLCWVNAHVQPLVWLGGETGLNIPCYRLHLSAWCCLPVLGLIQVQGGRKTIMHCLPSSFSSLPCSDTGEVCLAFSETVLSSNQPATTMATIISSSVVFFLLLFFLSSWPFLFK